jgi:S-adenosyl-L-methionine hydrolase (adenosine-forming)
MAIVTLISDWQNDDFYTSAVKGHLYSHCPGVNVVDITHRIEPFKYMQAAFVLKNAFTYFPKGTIHLVCVNAETSANTPPVAIYINGHYFVGAANGIFGLIFDSPPQQAVKIETNGQWFDSTFPELTLYVGAAAFLANGGNITELGPALTGQKYFMPIIPPYFDHGISGNVIYIDSYHNLITNITKSLFDEVGKNRNFKISLKSDQYVITTIAQKYNDVEINELLALFNSLGLLEIAIRNVPMASLLNLKVNAPVNIIFK